jgi:stress response protein YsnF
LIDEQVEVERVAVDRAVDSPVPVRHVGDTIIVPVLQEVLVVEKQLRLVEELHIRKKRSERRQPQTVTLRKEEATVERLDGDSREPRGE